jgi:HTH-type transcriptional regulator/antitoxin HipB
MDEIRNDRAYRRSKARLRSLREALSLGSSSPRRFSGRARQGGIGELRRQATQLVCSIAGYEALKAGGGMLVDLGSLQDLGLALIKARIARSWSQQRLAEALNMPKQQVQRYEATEYASASLRRIVEVADTLQVSFTGTAGTGSSPRQASDVDPRMLARSLAGFVAAEAVQDIEQRIRLRTMTSDAARKIFDDLSATYYRLSPLHETGGSDRLRGIAHRLTVRKALDALARRRGDYP